MMVDPELPATELPATELPASDQHAPPSGAVALLRDMGPEDLDFIVALDKKLFGADAWPKSMFVHELAHPATRRYVIAEVSDSAGGSLAVGYAGLMCVPPTGDIQTIGVLPDHEGRGIARAMLDELIAEAASRGATEVMLEVSAVNPRAQRLYERYGFTHIHTRRKYYRDGSDGLVMHLPLPTPDASTTVKDHP